MKPKTKREKKLAAEKFNSGFKTGKHYVYDILSTILLSIVLLTVGIFAVIGIESLCK